MKLIKIIISLISVCVFFSSCYVARMPEESSEEETFTSEISSEETSSDDYFIENNIKFSKPAVPKIDFEKDFYAQVKNNYISNASRYSFNFVFVDEQENCYVQILDGEFSCYNIKGKKTVIEGINEGCYKIKDTIYFWNSRVDGPFVYDLYALINGKTSLIKENIKYPILSKNKLYFSSAAKDYNGEKTAVYRENILYCLSNGSTKPQKIKLYIDSVYPYLEYGNKFWWKRSKELLEYDPQYLRFYSLPEMQDYEYDSLLTLAGDYAYFWENEHNYIIQYNLETDEKIYCKSPFLPETVTESSEQKQYYSVYDFNFTDSYFFFVNNDKIVRTDLDFENRTELDVNLGELYEININKNRIFIRYLKPNAGASDRFSVAEIDKDGKVLKIFE